MDLRAKGRLRKAGLRSDAEGFKAAEAQDWKPFF